MKADPLPDTAVAHEADRLIAAGPSGWRLARFGPRGRALGRLIGRIARGGVPYQQMVDRTLLDSVGHVDRRVDTLLARLDARDRSHTSLADRLQADEELLDDLVAALEGLRASFAARLGDGGPRPHVADLLAASRARPYVEPAFETWDEPGVGEVMGFARAAAGHDGAQEHYKLFEDRFRGPEERVRELQRPYLGLLDGRGPVLDVGCGRGEMLDLLREREIACSGVDADAAMVNRCAAKGHADVTLATANAHLASLPEAHFGAIFCAQLVEHLPYAELNELLRLARRGLRPGGLFIAETVNPHAPQALRAFWTDLTHQHPIFPEVALALCELAGFNSAYVFHPTGTGGVEVDSWTQSAYAVVARTTCPPAET